MLVTVKADGAFRSQVTELASIFEAKILDVGYDAMTLMVAGAPEKLDAMTELLAPYEIVELQRTGPDRAGEAVPRVQQAQAGQEQGRLSPPRLRPPHHRHTRGNRMPATISYDDDADLGLLSGKKVAILGYGSQGHAHALNLKDSGVDVIVGLREGSKSKAKAEEAGLTVLPTGEAVAAADIVMVLLPDTEQKKVYEAEIAPNLSAGQLAGVRARLQHPLRPDRAARGRRRLDDRAEGPGSPRAPHLRRGRRRARARRGRPGRDRQRARDRRSRTRKGIGATRGGVLDTTFEEETETDLFGEQVVLCGGLVELIRNGFETLVEAGYQPESAYFETLHEVKLIVDLIYEGGIANMRYSISDTAEYGDMTRGPRDRELVDQGRDAQDPRRDPERPVRQGVDRRERGGPPELRPAARGVGEAPDRGRRHAAALDDAVDRGRQDQAPGRQRRLDPVGRGIGVRGYASKCFFMPAQAPEMVGARMSLSMSGRTSTP